MSEHASQLDSFFSSIIKLMSGRASFLLLLVYALAFPHVSLTQVLYGSLTGTVTDPSSAVVSGAKVRSAEIRTGLPCTSSTRKTIVLHREPVNGRWFPGSVDYR